MKIVLCGSSGFVGSALKKFFLQNQYDVAAISIRSSTSLENIIHAIDNADVVINLSG
ncbi:MAG: NAD-dependent epimerase/dehydratase family protein, partial [Sulfuricurvum sp.]